MKVEFLDGSSLAKRLPSLMNRCQKLDIAMAYVKIGGLRTLLKNITDLVKKEVPIRIVFGLSSRHGITDKKSAETLLELSLLDNVIVKKWNNSGFHPKLLIIHGDSPTIIVGSSNLTTAGYGMNAEANLLVKNPESQLLKETLEFFKHYFDNAPNLKRVDVETYKPMKKIPIRGSGIKIQEDDLPPPIKRKHRLLSIRPKSIWKISPGADARYWNEWLDTIDDDNRGIVAIGWDIVGDLDEFKSFDSLKEAVKLTAEEVWDKNSKRKSKIGYIANQLWQFSRDISQGDVFIIYSETRVLGIALVTRQSTYQYWRIDTIIYGNQINVEYLWQSEWPKRTDNKIISILGKQGTLRLIHEEGVWDLILKTLNL